MFANDPKYSLQKEVTIEGITYRFYVPVNVTDYHLKRHVEASRHAAYAGAGVTHEILKAHCNYILKISESASSFQDYRNNVVNVMTALLFRTEKPVDQHAGVRMGAILSFMEYDLDGQTYSEDPENPEYVWLMKKEQLAFINDDLYAFFLSWGAANVKEWFSHSDTLQDQEYFLTRQKTLMAMIPKELSSQLISLSMKSMTTS